MVDPAVLNLILDNTWRICGGCGKTKNIREYMKDEDGRLPICAACLAPLLGVEV